MQLQFCKLTAGNAAGTGDDQQGSQVTDEHGQHVLQTQGDCLFQRHFAVQLKCSFRQLIGFLHKKASLSEFFYHFSITFYE